MRHWAVTPSTDRSVRFSRLVEGDAVWIQFSAVRCAMSQDAQSGAMDSRDRREEIYQVPRDTGYDTCLASEVFESLSARPRRLRSPIQLESLSPAGRSALMSGTPTRRSSEELRLQQAVSYTHLTLPTKRIV